jgi:hypothetical protein
MDIFLHSTPPNTYAYRLHCIACLIVCLNILLSLPLYRVVGSPSFVLLRYIQMIYTL